MKVSFKHYSKLLILVLLIIYSAVYVYDEIVIGGVPTGGYVFFNIPLGALLLFLSQNIFKSNIVWEKTTAGIGILISTLVLIPPQIYYFFFLD